MIVDIYIIYAQMRLALSPRSSDIHLSDGLLLLLLFGKSLEKLHRWRRFARARYFYFRANFDIGRERDVCSDGGKKKERKKERESH